MNFKDQVCLKEKGKIEKGEELLFKLFNPNII